MVTSSEDKVMEAEHGTTLIDGNLKTDTSPVVSSSPDSPLDNSFRDVDYEPEKSLSRTSSLPGNDPGEIQLDSAERKKPGIVSCESDNESSDEDSAEGKKPGIVCCESDNESSDEDSAEGKKPGIVSCESDNESSDDDSPPPVPAPAVTGENSDSSPENVLATESPPKQVMERSADEPYRIPSSVFARNNSTNPMDWSVASNESLFSLHMGNMSFTKDLLLWPSGELGTPVSGQMCKFSVLNSPAYESAESTSGELRTDAEANIANKVKRESEEDLDNDKSIAEGRISRVSEESNHSTKSFAFPVLAGDVEGSVRMARVSPCTQQPKTQTEPEPEPEANLSPGSAQPEPKDEADKATQQASSTKWFPCFTCCSFCS